MSDVLVVEGLAKRFGETPVFEQVARTEGIGGLIRRMKGNTRARPVVTA